MCVCVEIDIYLHTSVYIRNSGLRKEKDKHNRVYLYNSRLQIDTTQNSFCSEDNIN